MKQELEELLLQSGVKGMKWGKRKAPEKAKGEGVGSKVKAHVNSIKREHGWNKQLKKAGDMSTKDIQKLSARAQLENDMKKLSKKRGVGSKKEKADYLKRDKMDDKELFRKVQRLRAKDNLKRQAEEATKKQRETAKKIVAAAAPLALSYALTGRVTKQSLMSAAMAAAMSAGGEKAKMVKGLHNQAQQIKKGNTKHSDDLVDVLLHSIETGGVEMDQEVQEFILKLLTDDDMLLDLLEDEDGVVHDALEFDDILMHLFEDEDELQHFGVKGMKWGKVRSKIQKAVKARNQKINQKTLDRHEKNKENKTYKKLYDKNSKKYKTHLAAARVTQRQVGAIKANRVKLAAHLAVTAGIMAQPALKKAGRAAAKAARNPENIRRAKNVVQALKRSPIRYVDGSKMKNVVN